MLVLRFGNQMWSVLGVLQDIINIYLKNNFKIV